MLHATTSRPSATACFHQDMIPALHTVRRRGSLLASQCVQAWSRATGPNPATRTASLQASRIGTRAHASTAAGDNANDAAASAPRVVVLGGGFGGLYAAVRLDQLLWPRGKKPQVVLVDQQEKFVFKPLLYELINGTATEEEVAPAFAQLLAPYPVRFVQASVTSVKPGSKDTPSEDIASGHVQLSDGSSLPYDYLVVALGSQPDSRGVPGVTQWSVPFNSCEDATRVRGTLDLLADSGARGNVVVVGAGYAGVELACVIAERLRSSGGAGVAVQLVTPGADVLEGAPEGQKDAARKVLADLSVQVMAGMRVRELGPPAPDAAIPTACTLSMHRVDADASEATSMPADLVIWTAGSSPALKRVRQGYPFPSNERGAIITEPTLAVHGMEHVFALGDIAAAVPEPVASDASATSSNSGFPATAQVAFQQADYAAWNVWASINGRQLLPFRYQHLGSMMALGQLNAAVALPIPVPLPITSSLQSSPLGPLLNSLGVHISSKDPDSGITLEGPLAALVRRGAYLYRQPTNEQRISVATGWLQKGLEAAALIVGARKPQ